MIESIELAGASKFPVSIDTKWSELTYQKDYYHLSS
jgi:hypothetical protein